MTTIIYAGVCDIILPEHVHLSYYTILSVVNLLRFNVHLAHQSTCVADFTKSKNMKTIMLVRTGHVKNCELSIFLSVFPGLDI